MSDPVLKPWEKYAKAPTGSAKPWEKYSTATAAPEPLKRVIPSPQALDAYNTFTAKPPAPEMGIGERVADVAMAGGTGLGQGAMELVGLPGTAPDIAETGARKVAGLLGMDTSQIPEGYIAQFLPGGGPMFASGSEIRAGVSDLTGGLSEYDPKTTTGEFAQTIGQFIGGGMKPKLGAVAGLMSEGAGQATEGTALEPYARFAAGLLGPAAVTSLSNVASKAAAMGPWKAGIKSADDLIADASKLYAEGRASGAAATGKETRKLFDDLWSFGKAEDVITPANRIASDVSAVSSFYRMLKDYAGKAMSPGAMRSLRTEITTAMQTAKGNELRLLKGLQAKFDDFMYSRVPQFKEADSLYSRGMSGKDADKMIARAEMRAGQFSQSGMENALRTEARGIERKLIDEKIRDYTPDEEAMISKLTARPAAIADQVSKFAPTSVMPIMASVGLGAAANSVVPGLGYLLGPAAAAAGGITRAALTRNQKNTAELFNLLRRTESGMLPSYATGSKLGAAGRAIPGLLAQ